MKKQFRSSYVLGLGMAALLLAVGACSDDDDDSPGTGGSSGSGGMNVGGSKAGNPGTAGKSPTAGATPGGGSAGAAPMTAGGEGGSSGEMGGGGAGGDAGSAGDTSSAGGGGLGQAGGGGADRAGSGGEGGVVNADGCDYTETDDDQDEETDLTASGTVKTICGAVNNGDFEPVEGLVDRDGFEFSMPDAVSGLIRLELASPDGLDNVTLYVNELPAHAVDGRLSYRFVTTHDGIQTVAVRTLNAEDIAEPIPYRLSVVLDDVDARCAASAAATTFTEANDGASHDGNDVYEFSSQYVAAFTAGSDSPETTGITIAAPPAAYRIDGISADVTFTGSYYDGDAFAFHTGPNASQLTIRADWAGADRDFDLHLFEAGEVLEHAAGFELASSSGEYLTTMVEPDTDYVLWAGLYAGTRPSPYSLTFCSEAFSLTDE